MRKAFLFAACMIAAAAGAQTVTIYDASREERGDSIDRVDYEVMYNLEAMVPGKGDTTRYDERMLLQAGPHRSAFFSYVGYQVDSMVMEQMAKGENVNITASQRVSWKLYGNYPATGQTTWLDRVATDNFSVVEPWKEPEWQLVADSVRTVLGYRCQLARAQYLGRQWNAWFAIDVPIDSGPWKLRGLPGLILLAYDSGREFVFTAVGLANVHGARNIYYKGCHSTGLSRRDLNKIYKRYYADAIGYARLAFPQSAGNTISIRDGEGNELMHSKPVAYNLIEW